MKRILHVWIVNYKPIDYSNGQIIALSLNILEFYDFFLFLWFADVRQNVLLI